MINVYRDVFDKDDVQLIQEYIISQNWQFGHVSASNDDQTNYKKFWIMTLRNDPVFTQYFFEKVKKIIGKNFTLLDVYFNGQTHGLSGSWHKDSTNDNEYTFLYYSNTDWKIHWGGETIFEIDNVIHHFLPIPNTGLLFPGNVWHFANGPSRDCYDLRTTLAFKLRDETQSSTQ